MKNSFGTLETIACEMKECDMVFVSSLISGDELRLTDLQGENGFLSWT